MRKIAIVGAGQAGILLAFALKKTGYNVTLFSNRSAEQIKNGRILSSQIMHEPALQIERKWGLNFWDQECPWNNTFYFATHSPNAEYKASHWQGSTQNAFQSIDQRLKFHRWLNEYKKIGGKLIIQQIGLSHLNEISQQHDLTVVASGGSEISQIFSRDNERSVFTKPMRVLACFYVKQRKFPRSCGNGISGVGECLIVPGLSLNGCCEMILFEGIPGGAFDCWQGLKTPQEQLNKSIELLKCYVPWEMEERETLELIDDQAILIGGYTPVVRKPTIQMPCGKFILGMADTVVLNDPISGQGANSATKCADIYFERIIAHGNQPFDAVWMQNTFENYWEQCGRAATQFSTLLLSPQPYLNEFIEASIKIPALADQWANGFAEPASLLTWIHDKSKLQQMINRFKANLY